MVLGADEGFPLGNKEGAALTAEQEHLDVSQGVYYFRVGEQIDILLV